MCVSRIQRLMTAFMLGLVIVLFFLGYTNVALGLQIFIIAMLTLWALTNFCPSIWVLKKIFPPCSWENK